MLLCSQLADEPAIETQPYILFSVHKDFENNVANLLRYLGDKRGAQIFLDSKGTKGILIPAPDDADILGSDLAFRCVVFEAPKPASQPQPPVQQRLQQSVQQNDHQEAAASFYSSLKREKVCEQYLDDKNASLFGYTLRCSLLSGTGHAAHVDHFSPPQSEQLGQVCADPALEVSEEEMESVSFATCLEGLTPSDLCDAPLLHLQSERRVRATLAAEP